MIQYYDRIIYFLYFYKYTNNFENSYINHNHKVLEKQSYNISLIHGVPSISPQLDALVNLHRHFMPL